MGNVQGLHGLSQFFRLGQCASQVGFGQQAGEFFTTVARRQIVGAAHIRLQRPGHRLQTTVADQVTIAVVKLLEMININQ